MIEKLKLLNNKLIEINQDNKLNLKKYQLIQKILNDNKCFGKIPIEYAYAILKDLEIPENNIKEVYMELINIDNI